MLDLLDDILRRADAGEAVAVCTVVRTRGSTPQKVGAVMLVRRDGSTAGTIGGGCVEAEVRTRALERLAGGGAAPAALLSFKLDHDLGWDDGLVCGGVMDVGVEVIDSPALAAAYRTAREHLAAGREAEVRVTAVDEHGAMATFARTIEPTPTLVIAGAGHVGAALAPIASGAGFDVVVIDDRADLASASRFWARVVVGEIEDELARFPVTPHTYVVIVTRGHRHDGRALAAVVGSPARYVGLIGSKRKIVTILEDLHRGGAGMPREQLRRIHAPIGLDVGAVTPGEIAVSIAAELVAVRRRGDASRSAPAKPMRLTDAQLDHVLSITGPEPGR